MRLSNLVRSLFRPARRPSRCPASRRFRPGFEALGERIMPALDCTWAPVGGSKDWSVAANWLGSVKPTTADNIIIPSTAGDINLNIGSVNKITTDRLWGGKLSLQDGAGAGVALSVGTLLMIGGTVYDPSATQALTVRTASTWGHRDGAGHSDGAAGIDNVKVSLSGTSTNSFLSTLNYHATSIVADQYSTTTIVNMKWFDDAGGGVLNSGQLNLVKLDTGDMYEGGLPAGSGTNRADGIKNVVVSGFATGTISCVGSGNNYTVRAWIESNGIVEVGTGATLNITSRPTSTFTNGLYVTAGTVQLSGTATLTCTYDALFDGSTLMALKAAVQTTSQSATFDADSITFQDAASCQFQSTTGLESVASASDWIFAYGTSIYQTIDFTTATPATSSLACGSITIGTGCNYTLSIVGTPPPGVGPGPTPAATTTGAPPPGGGHVPVPFSMIMTSNSYTGDWSNWYGIPTGWTHSVGGFGTLTITKP